MVSIRFVIQASLPCYPKIHNPLLLRDCHGSIPICIPHPKSLSRSPYYGLLCTHKWSWPNPELGGAPPNPPIWRTGASPKPPPQGLKGEPQTRFALMVGTGINGAVRWVYTVAFYGRRSWGMRVNRQNWDALDRSWDQIPYSIDRI